MGIYNKNRKNNLKKWQQHVYSSFLTRYTLHLIPAIITFPSADAELKTKQKEKRKKKKNTNIFEASNDVQHVSLRYLPPFCSLNFEWLEFVLLFIFVPSFWNLLKWRKGKNYFCKELFLWCSLPMNAQE